MASTDQDFTVSFLYGNLRVEIINCLNEYIDNDEVDRLEELKDRFSECLPEEERRRVRNVKQLVDALERQGVIRQNNVKIIKLLAGRIGLQALVEKIEEYEYDCSGFITKIFKGVAGAVKTSAIQVKAVLSSREVQATALAAAIVMKYGASPETLQNLKTFKDVRAEVLALLQRSVVFVLKVSSIASIKRLWKGYKDGSLKKSMKKDLNEMKELKELSKGEEIDVELTIDEEEYQEVYWNLIISEVKANDARQNDEKQPTLSRRHSIGCEQDVPKSSNLPGVSYLHIQAWRHIDELNKVLSNFKSIKAKKETSEDTAIALKEVISMVEQEEKRLREIRQELSDLNIEIGFEKVKVEGKAELTVIQEKVKSTDLGASTSFQAEEVEKQSDQSTQVPHPDQMTHDEKLSSAADARKAGEKLEEQSVVAMCDKERMSETQQLLLKERFPFFKDDVIPTELLDNLPCLTNEQKDEIAYDEKNYLHSKSVETLVEKLKEHKEGFEQFVEALRKADLGHVAALLHANYFDIPIIVRIKGQMKLEREIASKYSNSFSKEAKKLRQDFEKMLPGIYFVRTKLMEDISVKDEGTKTTGAEDVPHSTEDSLAVIFRLNKINLLDKLWQMYKDGRLDAVFQLVWSKELSSSFVHLSFRKEDYDECERTLKEDLREQSTPIALESSLSTVGSYTSVQVASLLKKYLDKEGYNNWLKVGFTLDLIRKELQSHIKTETKAFHRKMIAKLQGFPPCICFYMPSRPNPYHDMKTCSWAKELEKHHRKQSPAWNQSDASLWKHRDVGHWEVAKLFISPQAIVKKGAVDLEINDLLTILSTCDHFELVNKAVIQDLKNVRSGWVHAVDQEIDEEKTKASFEKMKRFLNETKVLADKKQLKKVELLETEPLVFGETKE